MTRTFKAFLLSAFVFGALSGCIQHQTEGTTANDTPRVDTPPARGNSTYEEPPVEPAVKGPATEPSKKKKSYY